MPNKNTITIALVLAVAVVAIAFGNLSLLTNAEQKTMAQGVPSEIPDEVLYDQVFQLTIAFETEAESQKKQGEPITAFATYFKDKTQLTEEENQILLQVASDFIVEVKSIDEEAAQLIEELRSSDPKNDYIEPPAKLASLQEERNSVVLIYRSRLNSLLGSTKFSEFDSLANSILSLMENSHPVFRSYRFHQI